VARRVETARRTARLPSWFIWATPTNLIVLFITLAYSKSVYDTEGIQIQGQARISFPDISNSIIRAVTIDL